MILGYSDILERAEKSIWRKKVGRMRKRISRYVAVLIAAIMVLAMGITAFAEDENSEDNANKGTLTINHTVDGKKIDLYQIFSATVSGEGDSRHISYELNTNYVGFFQENIDGASNKKGEELNELAYDYVAKGNADNAQLAKNLLAYTDTKKIKADRSPLSEKDATKVTFLLYGYYLVVPEGATDDSTSTEGAAVKSPAMLVSVIDDKATINMKSNYPTIDKEIIPAQTTTGKTISASAIVNDNWEEVSHMGLDDDETETEENGIAPQHVTGTEEEKADDVEIGDTITYKLTSKVPDMTGYSSYVFKFTDTLSKGLDLKEIQSVKVGNTTLSAKKSGSNTYALSYVKNDDDTHTLTITFNDFYNSFKSHVGDTVTVIYTATLNKDAVTGMNPNTNTAEVEYSNDPSGTGTGKSTPSEAEVYTFNFKILKQNEQQSPLAGAQFELYRSKTENNEPVIDESKKIALIKEETKDNSNLYREATTEEAGKTGFTSAIIESGTDGYAQVKGLEEGTYFLREVQAPAGYNKLTGDIKIVITADYSNDTEDLSDFHIKYTYGTNTETDLNISSKDDFAVIPVTNKTGAELPSTGARSALLVTVAGILLFAVMAGSSLYSKRKENR